MALAFPGAPDARVARAWSCQRTFAADRLPVLGPDARLPGLYYCAGLGGFGLTVGLVAGRIVADSVRGHDIDPTFAALGPARLSARLSPHLS
jgi:D-arginine dehydrogenase